MHALRHRLEAAQKPRPEAAPRAARLARNPLLARFQSRQWEHTFGIRSTFPHQSSSLNPPGDSVSPNPLASQDVHGGIGP